MSHAIITSAIENMQLLTFDYDELPRIVEPHTYGVDKNDQLMLVGYQVGGSTRSGKLGWKSFSEHQMQNLATSETHFKFPRREYKRNDRAFKKIIAQL